jgi:hypothetical protein
MWPGAKKMLALPSSTPEDTKVKQEQEEPVSDHDDEGDFMLPPTSKQSLRKMLPCPLVPGPVQAVSHGKASAGPKPPPPVPKARPQGKASRASGFE